MSQASPTNKCKAEHFSSGNILPFFIKPLTEIFFSL